jgi:hypothetical protein
MGEEDETPSSGKKCLRKAGDPETGRQIHNSNEETDAIEGYNSAEGRSSSEGGVGIRDRVGKAG